MIAATELSHRPLGRWVFLSAPVSAWMYASLVIVAPGTVSMAAVCVCTVSCLSSGTGMVSSTCDRRLSGEVEMLTFVTFYPLTVRVAWTDP